MPFSEDLRLASEDQWNRIINHRFTTELRDGTIDREVMKKYLIQDHRFLDAFVVLLASIIANCRTLPDRIPGCQFLALITGQENTYFERCFQKLGVGEADRAKIPDAPCTTGFCNLMLEVARKGTLAEMLAVIVVCEWSYLSWGQLVEKTTVRDDFVTYEWVDLHTGKDFESVVEYLRGLLDQEGEIISCEEKSRCRERFLQAVQLEEEFFDFAYS